MKIFSHFFALALGILCSTPFVFAGNQPNPKGSGADAPTTLSLAFGTSLPDSFQASTDIDPRGPSRQSGGEIISIDFKNTKTIGTVGLSAFSASGSGKILVLDAQATMPGANGGTNFSLGELFSFAQKGAGFYNDYQGNVMLENNNYVSTSVNQALTHLQFQLEGFSENDATVLIQITTSEGINYYDFNLTRHNTEHGGQPLPPPHQPPQQPPMGNSKFEWVGSSCDLVAADGHVIHSGYPASYCSGATFQWVGSYCDLVTPAGYVVQSGYAYSYCSGATFQWVGSACDLVTPAGYVVQSNYAFSFCTGATFQWVGSACDLVTPAGYVVQSGYSPSYCN